MRSPARKDSITMLQKKQNLKTLLVIGEHTHTHYELRGDLMQPVREFHVRYRATFIGKLCNGFLAKGRRRFWSVFLVERTPPAPPMLIKIWTTWDAR